MDRLVGKLIGDCRIEELIGAGGMGKVYRAEHVLLHKSFAVKVLPDDPAEARTLAELRHPGIVAAHDLGESGGIYYLVMEYVSGPEGPPLSLRDYLKQQPDGRLPQEKVRSWSIQLADALAYAHSRGVVHRDIKPGNILIDADWKLRITDFGLARRTGAAGESAPANFDESMAGKTLPAPGVEPAEPAEESFAGDTRPAPGAANADSSPPIDVAGTYDYMAPEQRSGRGPFDARTDTYAFGVLLYRMLTGAVPAGFAKPPSQAVPGLWRRWDAIVARCMAPAPEERYQSAGELLADLGRVSGRRVGGPAAVLAALLLVAAVGAVRIAGQFRQSPEQPAPVGGRNIVATIGDGSLPIAKAQKHPVPPPDVLPEDCPDSTVATATGTSEESYDAADAAARGDATRQAALSALAGKLESDRLRQLIANAIGRHPADCIRASRELERGQDHDGIFSVKMEAEVSSLVLASDISRIVPALEACAPAVVVRTEEVGDAEAGLGAWAGKVLGAEAAYAELPVLEEAGRDDAWPTYTVKLAVSGSTRERTIYNVNVNLSTVRVQATVTDGSGKVIASRTGSADGGGQNLSGMRPAAEKAVQQLAPLALEDILDHWMRTAVLRDGILIEASLRQDSVMRMLEKLKATNEIAQVKLLRPSTNGDALLWVHGQITADELADWIKRASNEIVELSGFWLVAIPRSPRCVHVFPDHEDPEF